MVIRSPILRDVVDGHGGRALAFYCPGCNDVHVVYIASTRPGPLWGFNYDYDKPTISPSVRVSIAEQTLCHMMVKDGKIQFLSDCAHLLANKTVDIPPWPYKPGEYGGIEE